MALANGTFPPPVDPFTQPVTLLLPDGTPFNVTMDDFAEMHFYGVNMGIFYGVATGMSLITIVAYALLIQPSKRRNIIYALNMLALIFNLVKSVLRCVYYAGPWQNPYAYFADDWSQVPPSAYADSIVATVMKVLQLACMETSLILQVNTILFTTSRYRRWLLVGLSTLVGLVATALSFALMVVNCEGIMSLQSGWGWQSLTNAASIAVTVSICFFFVIFTWKLGYALKRRRTLGIKKFGPLQILFIMSLQTMIIPAIFSIAQFWSPINDLYTMTLSLATIMLPLSALWAQASLEENGPSHRAYTPAKMPLVGSYGSAPSAQKAEFNRCGKETMLSSSTSGEMEKDVEMQTNNINIIINKS
jgi:pheromone alpha factor receptor